jgi:hypothetical protein
MGNNSLWALEQLNNGIRVYLPNVDSSYYERDLFSLNIYRRYKHHSHAYTEQQFLSDDIDGWEKYTGEPVNRIYCSECGNPKHNSPTIRGCDNCLQLNPQKSSHIMYDDDDDILLLKLLYADAYEKYLKHRPHTEKEKIDINEELRKSREAINLLFAQKYENKKGE